MQYGTSSQIIRRYSNNVQFEGLTFKGSKFAALLLENDGDVIFTDCLFTVRMNVSVVVSVYLQARARRL